MFSLFRWLRCVNIQENLAEIPPVSLVENQKTVAIVHAFVYSANNLMPLDQDAEIDDLLPTTRFLIMLIDTQA